MRRLLLPAMLAVATTATCTTAPESAAGVRYVILVRHGAYDRVSTADDRVANGLNALGREQAGLVAARLARLPVRPSRLVSSDFTRARQTAAEIGRDLGIGNAPDALLRECTPPSAVDAGSASCESSLAAAWAKYARPAAGADAHDVLVCHGNVIRWFAARAMGADTRRWRAMEIANASLTVIAVQADGSTRLVEFSDVGHLPPAKQSWTGGGWDLPPKP